ncbi:hypothetical protein M8998_01580 [Sphingobacterium sp. lm-10]|uniref:hypothetical protein n=1 Tax=Sphingobacterium sp. lm-10 TaxID=2944904 RepID=UPI002021D03B|nr:hypothetical protein [Sphingobacterium sp. lm-10]MCL7986621.1 hypothetical protein [Sphingobacterium sp. lm-10]
MSKLLIYVYKVDSTLFLFNLFISFELLLLTNFLARIHHNWSRMLYVSIVLFLFMLTISVIDFLWHPIYWTKWMKPLSHIVIVSFIGLNLVRGINLRFDKHGTLTVHYALLLYYFVSTILFLIMEQLPNIHIENAALLWGINNLLSTILYATCIYHFYSLRKSY